MTPALETPSEVARLLAADAPVAVGVSGGKDSCAAAFATAAHLDAIGHRGPRLLVHSDLGLVEWRDSLPTCERLAAALGWELLVLRRAAGGLMERWEARWRNNVARYRELRCVRLILPWSTPSMRFCTSELKTDVICRALARRWPNHAIVNALGIRADESTERAKASPCRPQAKLASRTHATTGLDWLPILRWSVEDVWREIRSRGFEPHEAYSVYGSSRVSCAFCIMSRASDLAAAARAEENAGLYRRMVALEAASTFAFQGKHWLADVAPRLLDDRLASAVALAKRGAEMRASAEARIPAEHLFVRGWPTRIPDDEDAQLIGSARLAVARAVGIAGVRYTKGPEVVARYRELLAEKAERESKRRHRRAG